MGNINLKQLKEALNTLSDENLDKYEVTNMNTGDFEDPDNKVDVIFFADEEEHSKLLEIFELDGMKTVKKFVQDIVNDSRKVFAASIDDEYKEFLSEQTHY